MISLTLEGLHVIDVIKPLAEKNAKNGDTKSQDSNT